jgi:dihydrofolate reductase
MRKIIYYVAMSLDGYIVGPNDNIEGFVSGGSGVDKYLNDLQEFDTVIMGRNTYEFGFKYGIVPGQPAYGHMEHYIFSNSASYENLHEKVHLVPTDISVVSDLKKRSGSDIYLCGGSLFAGWLLKHQLIDELKVKLNPVLLGDGLPLFSSTAQHLKLDLQEVQEFDHGLVISKYKINY